MRKEIIIPLLALHYFLACFGLSSDSWWHNAIGRESFFILPHLIVYYGNSGVLFLSAYLFLKNKKEKESKRMFLFISLATFCGLIFDNIWHYFFGSEKIYEIWIAFSPPHIITTFLLVMVGIQILLLLEKNKKTIPSDIRTVSDVGVFAGILSYIHFILSPFFPLGGWAIIGLWGAAINTFPVMMLIMWFKEKIRPFGAMQMLGLLYLLLFISGGVFVDKPGHGIIQPHWIIPPIWIVSLAILAPIFLLELISYKKRIPTKYGFLTGLIYSVIIYAGIKFIHPLGQEVLSYPTLIVIVLLASFGAYLGGVVGKRWRLYR